MVVRILAQRYNNLQTRINAILGTPTNATPNTGYGQTVSSGQVVARTSKVSVVDYNNLANDMSRARTHQIGSNFGGIPPAVPTGVNRAKVLESYLQDLENLIPLIESNRDVHADSQMAVENLRNSANANISSSRNTTWNTFINYTFDVTFISLAHYRSFFNTGGEIRFVTSSDYVGSQAKSLDWRATLGNISTVRFTPTQTIAANGLITNATGGRTLTVGTTTTVINSASVSSTYSNNRFTVTVNRTTDTNIQFVVTLTDGPANTDEAVFGTITTTVSMLRANTGVIVTPPVGTNVDLY